MLGMRRTDLNREDVVGYAHVPSLPHPAHRQVGGAGGVLPPRGSMGREPVSEREICEQELT